MDISTEKQAEFRTNVTVTLLVQAPSLLKLVLTQVYFSNVKKD